MAVNPPAIHSNRSRLASKIARPVTPVMSAMTCWSWTFICVSALWRLQTTFGAWKKLLDCWLDFKAAATHLFALAMKPIAYCSLVLSCLITLPWPVAAFMSIFAFDAPSKGVFDDFVRIALVSLLLSYPWGLLVGFVRILTRSKGSEWATPLNTIFLLAPVAQIMILLLIAVISSTIDSLRHVFSSQ
jgi:hypothetical protein